MNTNNRKFAWVFGPPLAGLLLIAAFTPAQQSTPSTSEIQSMSSRSGALKGVPAGNYAIIWRGNDEMYQAIDLMKAGVDGEDKIVMQNISCRVPEGTKYVRTDDGSFNEGLYGYRNIMIIDGKYKGCIGTVTKKNIE